MAARLCKSCNTEFPATLEYFYRYVQGKNGLDYKCKSCRKKYNSESHKRNADARNAPKKTEGYKKKKRIWDRKYNKNNREAINANIKYRRATDPKFRLNTNVSSHINLAINDKNGRHWGSLVDFTLSELKEHLEAQFQPGMSWDNYGYRGWHIDHIKPKSLFNFESHEDPEFKECWCLANLQPLWAKDNLSKGAKY